MNGVLSFDRKLFYYINTAGQNRLMDEVLPLLRHSNFWVPLYLFLLVFVIINYKKNVLIWIVGIVLLVVLTNYISSDLIKAFIYRTRPCNDVTLQPPARLLLGYHPLSSSFTSSHATNHFAMAVFFYITLKEHIGKWAFGFFIWAATIAYAQVYVGVHFPLDVLSGGLIGSFFGYLAAWVYQKQFKLS